MQRNFKPVMIGAGKAFASPPLQTVQAYLPHTAPQSVFILLKLTEQFMDRSIGGKSFKYVIH